METEVELLALILRHADIVVKHPLEALDESNHEPWSVGCAVILSANTTDAAVNKILPTFLIRYPTPEAYIATYNKEQVIATLPAINHNAVKAGYLHNWAECLVKEGCPRDIESLQRIQGIGYKSACIIIHGVYGISAGLPLDTHALRIVQRTGWVKFSNNPEAIAKRLIAASIPVNRAYDVFAILTTHGRNICTTPKPKCNICKWQTNCTYFKCLTTSQPT